MVGVTLSGFWAGYLTGLILIFYTTYPMFSRAFGYFVLWTVPILIGVITGYFNQKLFPRSHVVSTSIIGAYLTIRGICAFTSEYTNEFLILNDIKEHRYTLVSGASYLCMIAVMVLAMIGIVVQYLINDVKNFREVYRENRHF